MYLYLLFRCTETVIPHKQEYPGLSLWLSELGASFQMAEQQLWADSDTAEQDLNVNTVNIVTELMKMKQSSD